MTSKYQNFLVFYSLIHVKFQGVFAQGNAPSNGASPSSATSSSGASIEKLCSDSTINSPFCEVYKSSCSSASTPSSSSTTCSNLDALLSKMCSSDFSKNSICDPIKASCSSNPSSCSASPSINAIPTAKSVSDSIYLICNDMPMMADCKTCPPPSMSPSGISNCALLSTYSKLCLDMPGMTECKKFTDFCSASPSSAFCGGSSSSTAQVQTVSTSKYCTESKDFCVSSVYKSATETCFQVASSSDGWVGIGMGQSVMAGSDIYMAWNDGSKVVVGNFQGSGPSQPRLRDDQSSLLSSSSLSSTEQSDLLTTAKLSFQFCRNNVISKVSISPNTPFIYAWSKQKPAAGSDLKTVSLAFHDGGYDAFIFPPPISRQLSSGSGLSDSQVSTYSDNLCSQMPNMPGCALRKSGYCSPFQCYATICEDMSSMTDCQTYTNTCKTGSTTVSAQCSSAAPPKNFPSSSNLTRAIYSICNEMSMPGCSSCSISSANSTYAECDLIGVYSSLCQSMPSMNQCSLYSSMCASTSSLPWCSTADMPPQMQMYFHTGIVDYVLFQKWVPRTNLQYFGTLLACFVSALLYELLVALNAVWEVQWRKQEMYGLKSNSTASLDDAAFGSKNNQIPLSVLPLYRHIGGLSRGSTGLKVAFQRGTMRLFTATLSFLLMLIVMSFNVGLFLAIVFGLAIGSFLFASMARLSLSEREIQFLPDPPLDCH